MRTAPPIHTTAKAPIEYIPTPQDAERYRRDKARQIHDDETRLAKLTADVAAGIADIVDDGLRAGEIADLEASIAEDYRLRDTTLASLAANYPAPMSFLIHVPTSLEREQISSRLIALGLTQVTQEQIRATMIEELFEQDWGKGSPEANEAEAEELAGFLDGVWQRQEAHDAAINRWQEQENERVLDEAAGSPARPRADLPPKIITVRENAKATLLVDRMMGASQRLRDLAARNTDFSRVNSLLLIRIHVLAATNVDVVLERDERARALTPASADALREAMDDASWYDLVGFVDRLYAVDGYEAGNSASPLGKPSLHNGLSEPSGDTAISGGPSTTSNIDPAPAVASETITGPSSGSHFAVVTGQVKATISPMAEA